METDLDLGFAELLIIDERVCVCVCENSGKKVADNQECVSLIRAVFASTSHLNPRFLLIQPVPSCLVQVFSY